MLRAASRVEGRAILYKGTAAIGSHRRPMILITPPSPSKKNDTARSNETETPKVPTPKVNPTSRTRNLPFCRFLS